MREGLAKREKKYLDSGIVARILKPVEVQSELDGREAEGVAGGQKKGETGVLVGKLRFGEDRCLDLLYLYIYCFRESLHRLVSSSGHRRQSPSVQRGE